MITHISTHETPKSHESKGIRHWGLGIGASAVVGVLAIAAAYSANDYNAENHYPYVVTGELHRPNHTYDFKAAFRLMCFNTSSKKRVIEFRGKELVSIDGAGERVIGFSKITRVEADSCDQATEAVLKGNDGLSVSGIMADLANVQDGRYSSDPAKVQSFTFHIDESVQDGARKVTVNF